MVTLCICTGKILDFHWFWLISIDFHWFPSFPCTKRLCLLIRWLSTLNQDISKGNEFCGTKKVLRQAIHKKYPELLCEVLGRSGNVLTTLESFSLWFGIWSSILILNFQPWQKLNFNRMLKIKIEKGTMLKQCFLTTSKNLTREKIK